MSLFVVATPIGNPGDLSPRARDILARADLVVGEDMKPLRQILKAAGVQARALDQLNEHSRQADVEHLTARARTEMVALVSDCGTPGFCDPGAELVDACHRAGIPVHAVAGPSSLMALLSVAGVRLDSFTFAGFLPAKNELRARAWREVLAERRPVILLETPYRCARLIEDLRTHAADRYCVVGLDLTQETELVLRGLGRELKGEYESREPVVLVLPKGFSVRGSK
jgi:16S rRNA (cytidine1402-2'-O)-methyltransferase